MASLYCLNAKPSIDYNQAIDNRGIVKDDLKQYNEAIKDYNQAIELNPQNAEAYSNRGNVKARLKQYTAAIKDYKKAKKLFEQQGDPEAVKITERKIKEIEEK